MRPRAHVKHKEKHATHSAYIVDLWAGLCAAVAVHGEAQIYSVDNVEHNADEEPEGGGEQPLATTGRPSTRSATPSLGLDTNINPQDKSTRQGHYERACYKHTKANQGDCTLCAIRRSPPSRP